MAQKPSNTPDWIPDNTTGIIIPGTSKQSAGWFKEERPPYQFHNWFWNIVSQFIHYFSGEAEYNIIIDTDANEGDYTTLAAYIADSPAAGDRVLVKVDEEISTSTMVIPDDISLKFQKGKKLWCDENISPLQFGDRIVVEGDLLLELSHTGTVPVAVSLNGDSCNISNIIVKNTTTGTITDAFKVESGVEGNKVKGETLNPSGTITNILNDNSGELSNDVYIRKSGGSAHRPDGLGVGWHGSQRQIKILPGDFKSGASTQQVYLLNTGGYVTIAGANSIVATYEIPVGYKATDVRVYASATETVFVYENDITDSSATTKGSGDTTAEFSFTAVEHSATNYISVQVVDVGGTEVRGGYIVIEPL